MPKPKAPVDPRYPWPEHPTSVTCPKCTKRVVLIRRFGRDVRLEGTPRRDRRGPFGLFGLDHELFGRCRPPSPF